MLRNLVQSRDTSYNLKQMIGPEDIHETPKMNQTPILILGIASLLLVIVGFISYRDYVNAKADDRIRKVEEKLSQLVSAQPPVAPTSINPAPTSINPAPPVINPEIEELRRQLEAMKVQAESIKVQTEKNKQLVEENSMKMDRVLSADPGSLKEPFNPNQSSRPGIGTLPPPGIKDDLTIPDYVRNSVAAPPGGSRYANENVEPSEVEKKIKSTPAIGNIVSYDEGWNLVTINAGTSNGVKKDQRYSIRRGSELLGIVKISEVFPTVSNANIVTNNRAFEGALKPKAGDDIIAYDPF